MKKSAYFLISFLALSNLFAEKLPKGVYTMDKLDEALATAKAEDKPIVFVHGDLTTN